MQGLQERSACVHFRDRLEQARGKWLLPLHTCRISLKFHVLLAGLNVCFITSAFQGSQSFGCADIKPRKWLKSSKVAIGCIFVLGIKTGAWLRKGLAPEDQQCWFLQCYLHEHPLIQLGLNFPDRVHALSHVAHWESKSCREEKKHLVNSVFVPSQRWPTARPYRCYCNAALITTNQRNTATVVKLLLDLVRKKAGPGEGSGAGLLAAACSPRRRGTAALRESDWSAGLDRRATTWFMVM